MTESMSGNTDKEPAPNGHLFVYGTLMQGECRHHLLARGGIRSIVGGTIRGTLFDLGSYPGMQRAHSGTARVKGELVEFEELDSILARIDDEEGPEYRRESIPVTLSDGSEQSAWTYVLTSHGVDRPQIESGDWRTRPQRVVCIDIGGTSTKVGVFEGGQVEYAGSLPSRGPAEEFASALSGLVAQAVSADLGAVSGMAVAIAGFLNEERDRLLYNSNLPWLENYPLRERLARDFSGPIQLESDSNAAALAEYYLGSGMGSSRFLCMAVGTGLGVGLIINGQPLRFAYGCLGDAGHVIVQPEGPLCACGGYGCAEVLLSAPRLGEEYRLKTGLEREQSLRDVIVAARDGDRIAEEVLEQAGVWLGIATASLANLFYPDCIAFAGGLAEADDLVMTSVRRTFDHYAGGFTKNRVTLKRATLGAMATLTGAAYSVLNEGK